MRNFVKVPTREELNKLIDNAADIIRTAVDYKFILVLLFLKRINDLYLHEREKAEKKLRDIGLSEDQIKKELDKEYNYTFNIPKDYLWDNITKDVKNLPTNLANAINEVAKRNEELQGVINRVDFLEFARNEENRELLKKLVELFNKYDLDGDELSPDIFGDAYEHILMKFAPQKAKEGEIYTPREVIRLLVSILDPKPDDKVYDPCCGSGGMLILSYKYVNAKYGDKVKRLSLFGQERNLEIYSICKMNLLSHGVKDFKIENGDTLLYPKFLKEGYRFDIVIANPPWNQDGYGEDTLKSAELKERFAFGYPPNNKADWAWIEHMLYSANDRGKVGVVIDNGCLFRGGVERSIRKNIVDKDYLDTVILLPEKLFYNTGAPGAIIILNKSKPADRKDKVLFINASNEYIKHPEIKRLNSLSDGNIRKIVDAYNSFKDIEGLSKVVSIEKIKENDYNLNVTLYATVLEEKEHIDLKEVYEELNELEEERGIVKRKIDEVMTKLNPFLALFLMLIRALADITNILDDASWWFNG